MKKQLRLTMNLFVFQLIVRICMKYRLKVTSSVTLGVRH